MSEQQTNDSVLKGQDKAVYTRQQKGHSILIAILTAGYLGLGIVLIPYYCLSPNHYWHM